MITIRDCLKQYSLTDAALVIANKVAFDKSKGFAKAYDHLLYWEFAGNLDTQISKIANRIHAYEFQPTVKREKQIRWKRRILYTSTWADKIVETWLSKSLNKLLSKWFSQRSYAYRSERLGIDNCQSDVIATIVQSKYVARRDIKNFFYSIDHTILLDILTKIIDPQDPLFNLIRQRVKFDYCQENGVVEQATIGLPFGSPIACLLANIYLTDLDNKMTQQVANYYRYADDFLIVAETPEPVLESAHLLDEGLTALKLQLNPTKNENLSFDVHDQFTKVNRFKYLGLEYWQNGVVRLPLEKKRKIIGIFRRSLQEVKTRHLSDSIEQRLKIAVECIKEATNKRIRYVAIIDYYLKHVNDENQLKVMDREIAEMVISAVLQKPFRRRDFKTIPYKHLRDLGLPSLVHRNRLHLHGHLRVPFLSLYNSILFERYDSIHQRRVDRTNQMNMARKLRRKGSANIS